MRVRAFLPESCVISELRARNARDALLEMCSVVEPHHPTAADTLRQNVLARWRVLPPVQGEIAVVEEAVGSWPDDVAVLARSSTGLVCESGLVVRLLILCLGPRWLVNAARLRFLLSQPGVCDEVMKARDHHGIFRALDNEDLKFPESSRDFLKAAFAIRQMRRGTKA